MNTRRYSLGLIAIVALVASATSSCHQTRVSAKPAPESTIAEVLRLPDAWSLTKGANATVAVLDWQFDPKSTAVRWYVADTSLVAGERIGALKPWHGAWMVDIVHHVAPEAHIMPIIARGLRADYRDYVALGIRYAADHGADVVTSSMGPVSMSSALRDAVSYAESRGTIFVNVHPEQVPGDSGKLVACRSGECDPRIVRAGIVSVPNHPAKANPVRDVYSWPYDLDARYEDGWGYSNAPPAIGAVLALMKSANRALAPSELKRLLVQTSYDRDGFRVVDAGAAVRAARAR